MLRRVLVGAVLCGLLVSCGPRIRRCDEGCPQDSVCDTNSGFCVRAPEDAGTAADSGTDAGADAGIDGDGDAGTDAGVDGGDAGADAGVDGGDAGTDAGLDGGVVTCSVSAPMNGTINGGTSAVVLGLGATATWACNVGYALSGTAPSCTGQNTLSGAEPTCVLSQCNDSIDDDGDGRLDFPNDPGCGDLSDDDEADDCASSGVTCPQCGNGRDDDGDTLADFPDDPGCVSASGTSELAACASADAVSTFTTNLTASFSGAANDVDLSCGSNGRDVVYRFFVATPLLSLSADTEGSASPTAVAFRAPTCSASDLVCATGNLGADARATLAAVAVGEYFIVVDDLADAGATTFNLNVVGIYPTGVRCNPASTILRCADGFACAGASGAETCVVAACNDAVDGDGDGFPGYPTDPGCSSVSDNDEDDLCPSGPGCPACSDQVDNDGDGKIDYPIDTSCTSAGGTSEN